MRQPKPFYRTQTCSFYVQLDGRQIDLGPDEPEAYRRWHLLMAGVDENAITAMNKAKPTEPKNLQSTTLHRLVKSYLGWQEAIETTAHVKGMVSLKTGVFRQHS